MRKGGHLAAAMMATLLAVLVSACGAPAYTYVTNSDAHTYFKVPREWQKIDSKELVKAIKERVDRRLRRQRQAGRPGRAQPQGQ